MVNAYLFCLTRTYMVDHFRQATDRFVNGDFYRHPLSAEDILRIVLELRVSRRRVRRQALG